MPARKNKHFFSDIGKKHHGWDSKVITSIAKDANITSCNKMYRRERSCNTKERYLSDEELETLEDFINNPNFLEEEKSLWYDYYGVPPYIRIT